MISLANTGRKHTPEARKRISQSLIELHKKVVSKRRSQGLVMYYQSHNVWNKGLPWPKEIRERIREGCLNSPIGVGPKPAQDKKNRRKCWPNNNVFTNQLSMGLSHKYKILSPVLI